MVDEIECEVCGAPALLKEAGLHPETGIPFRHYVCTSGHEMTCYYHDRGDGDDPRP